MRNLNLDFQLQTKLQMSHAGALVWMLLNEETKGSVADEDVAVIAESNVKRIALHVDGLIGQKPFVVKTLSKMLSKVVGVSGAVIMSDGIAAFVLDMNNVVNEFAG